MGRKKAAVRENHVTETIVVYRVNKKTIRPRNKGERVRSGNDSVERSCFSLSSQQYPESCSTPAHPVLHFWSLIPRKR
ncbi:hypothetical protein M0802_015560 [Mischocyttarus mexicanus]|nr:hypothetical protein M0802_015560 [Mischocyttarus mexicanus]